MMRSLAVVLLSVAFVSIVDACAGVPRGVSAAAEAKQVETLVIRGALAYRERIALAADSRAIVELREAGAGDGQVVAEQRIELGGRQVPVPFELAVSRAELVAGRTYTLHGGIVAATGPPWASEGIPIDAAAAAMDLGMLNLKQAEVEALSTRLRCGDVEISFADAGVPARLIVGQEAFDMRRAEAASGAKFVAVDDPTTILWNKGHATTLVLRGKTYPKCAPAGGSVFRASGNEPGWRLDIGSEKIILHSDDDQVRVEVPTPGAETTADYRRYVAHSAGTTLTVTILNRVCADTMSGMPYPHTVSVLVDGRMLQGCGGDPASTLQGEPWQVEEIEGVGIVQGSRVTLDFGADGRVSGNASCNSYSGSYVLTGEGMTVGRTATTMMACQPELMQQEMAFHAALAKVRRFELGPDGTLDLLGDGKRLIRARRS